MKLGEPKHFAESPQIRPVSSDEMEAGREDGSELTTAVYNGAPARSLRYLVLHPETPPRVLFNPPPKCVL